MADGDTATFSQFGDAVQLLMEDNVSDDETDDPETTDRLTFSITGDLWNPRVADDDSGLLGGPPWELDKYDQLNLRRRGT